MTPDSPADILTRDPPAAGTEAEASQRLGAIALVPAVLRDLGLDPLPVITQAGLAPGLFADPESMVPLGSLLLKQVVEDLRRSLPNLKRFVTLSPIPGFEKWLRKQPEYGRLGPQLEKGEWSKTASGSRAIERVMTSLCASYLLNAKRENEPLDPVARFHLRNGARLERINWLADLSERALKESYGMMVNYAYRPDEIESNHEAYSHKHQIAADSRIEFLARKSLKDRKDPLLAAG